MEILLSELQRDWPILEAVSYNELNIGEKLQNQTYELMKFNDQYIKAKVRMDELVDIKNRLVGKLYDKYRFDHDKALTSREIENYYIPNNADIIKVNNAISKQNIVISYFEMCVKAINQLQWNIKLYLQDRSYQ